MARADSAGKHRRRPPGSVAIVGTVQKSQRAAGRGSGQIVTGGFQPGTHGRNIGRIIRPSEGEIPARPAHGKCNSSAAAFWDTRGERPGATVRVPLFPREAAGQAGNGQSAANFLGGREIPRLIRVAARGRALLRARASSLACGRRHISGYGRPGANLRRYLRATSNSCGSGARSVSGSSVAGCLIVSSLACSASRSISGFSSSRPW